MEKYIQLKKFRSLMSLSVCKEDIERIWGRQYLKKIIDHHQRICKKRESLIVRKKIQIAQESVSSLLALKLVKFIGVTGSVAAGFAREEDDIDIYVVVRNKSMWLYRGIIVIRNLFHNKIRAKRHKEVKDKLCLNFVSEERGLKLEDDIFNFHELMYIIPIYNQRYLNFIYLENKWLVHKYNIRKELLETEIEEEKSVNCFFQLLNFFFYYFQVIFMLVSRHNPELKRLKENNKRGKIEFFPIGFKSERIGEYSKKFPEIEKF